MTISKLVYMANQIGSFFHTQGDSERIMGVVEHMINFWSPSMRTQIVAYINEGGEGLTPNVAAAIAQLSTLSVESSTTRIHEGAEGDG